MLKICENTMRFGRMLRNHDGLARLMVFLVLGGCLITTSMWMWSYTKTLHIKRELYQSLASMEVEEQPTTCPPCPETPIPPSAPVISTPPPSDLHDINCTIDGIETISCREDGDEVYMPVSFINSYFDVYGKKMGKRNQQYYEFRYSYGYVYPPQPVYHPGGVFLNFEKYHVERRSLIACVSACDGVPVASQWDPKGYYYAISVAQYGLSHHAKGLIEGNPPPKILANGYTDLSTWEIPEGSSLSAVNEQTKYGVRRVLAFNAPESLQSPGPKLMLGESGPTLCFDLKLMGPGGVTMEIKSKEGVTNYVHLNHEDSFITVANNNVYYGIGQKNSKKWLHHARDLYVDWMKTLEVGVKYNAPVHFNELISLTLHGQGFLDNVTVAKTAHNDHLIHAADWLVRNQDSVGGWPTMIAMKTGDIQLEAGWYSAMGQGQAMSTLVRAFNITGDKHYLDSAVKGLHLYTLGSEEGGVRARFLGQLDWYEEYPTTPRSTFVLNGFIFSMLGLYDVMKTVQGQGQVLAEKLWKSGLHSLKIMLGMYDSGTGTLYDLRHVINHEQPNRARWDYHTTHIALIQEMAIIDGDPIFYSAAERWIGYVFGKVSKHN